MVAFVNALVNTAQLEQGAMPGEFRWGGRTFHFTPDEAMQWAQVLRGWAMVAKASHEPTDD